jgi:hypothetical protein
MEVNMSLAEGRQGQPYPKLPFWDTVGLSYSTYFSNFIDALRASWLWLIVAAALTAVASWSQWSWMADVMANAKAGFRPQLARPFETVLLGNLDNVILLLAGVSIAVAWHRRMILNEQPPFSGINIVTKNLWRYIVNAVALFFIMFLPMAIFVLPGILLFAPRPETTPSLIFFLQIPIAFAAYGAGLAIATRLTLLLPARAIGNTNLTFTQAWNRTRGNVWRLLWGIAATTIPPMIIIQIAVLAKIGFTGRGSLGGLDFAAQMTALSALYVTYYLLVLPISIGFLSHAYRHFFEAPLEQAE